MVKACVDVDYREDQAIAACVLFHDWADSAPAQQIVEHVQGIAPYVPGQFYKRELPCLLAVLHKVSASLDLVVIDGYVWLVDECHPGLGAHLHEALGRRVPVIGVAKTRFASAVLAVPILRGETATRPLFVTAAGMDVNEAARCVQGMHGPHRLPTLIKLADMLCRGARGQLTRESESPGRGS
jgi:deoxyribonuclease V